MKVISREKKLESPHANERHFEIRKWEVGVICKNSSAGVLMTSLLYINIHGSIKCFLSLNIFVMVCGKNLHSVFLWAVVCISVHVVLIITIFIIIFITIVVVVITTTATIIIIY